MIIPNACYVKRMLIILNIMARSLTFYILYVINIKNNKGTHLHMKKTADIINDGPHDIFDRIMSLKIFRPLYPLYTRYKEILLYVFFGGLTTVIGFATFWLFTGPLGIHELKANVISWFFAVAFAYVTNRIWVFDSKADSKTGIVREAAAFYGGRLFTLGFEELMLLIFVTWLDYNEMLVKVIATVGVLILNYIISKLIIFKKPERES